MMDAGHTTNTDPLILRIARVDELSDPFVLVKVTHSGSDELDITLLATDGMSPFALSLKEKSVSQYQAKSFKGTSEEWQTTLRWLLLGLQADKSSSTHGVDLVASVTETKMTLSARQNIAGITQRLGTLELPVDEEQDIALFDWAGVAAMAAVEAQKEVNAAQALITVHQQRAIELQEQLDEFIKAKADSERELLEKFRLLLNSKKLKIRDQQRLLASAKIDPVAAGAVKKARGEGVRTYQGVRESTMTAGRRSKRVLSPAQTPPEVSDDDAFEAANTPEASDTDGTAEMEDSETSSRPAPEFPKHESRSTVQNTATQEEEKAQRGKALEQAAVPPPRKLPFDQKTAKLPALPTNDEDETDEEL